MIGSKHISDLITAQDVLKKGRINIIDAGVSAGKTYFALTTIPEWSSPEKILYLIDTTNGEMRIQENMLKRAQEGSDKAKPVNRLMYAFCDYNTGEIWGEKTETVGKMPVMTYAGFGTEIRQPASKFNYFAYDFIICDEMQNLVDFQRFSDRSANLEAAEEALRAIAVEGSTTIIAMSATPQKIRDRFGILCYEVPFDKSDLITPITTERIPYWEKAENLILRMKGKTGVLYTTQIEDMKRYIDFGNSNGIRTNGFWSTSVATAKKHPLSAEQSELRETVLVQETIPDDIDLLVINRASETCIKIQETKRKIDYMIVHDSNEEIQTQVRGRYHGDLAQFFFHDNDALNLYKIKTHPVPDRYLNRPLSTEEIRDLGWELNLLNKDGKHCGNPTIIKCLKECGYNVSDPKKSRKHSGKHFRTITIDDTISR